MQRTKQKKSKTLKRTIEVTEFNIMQNDVIIATTNNKSFAEQIKTALELAIEPEDSETIFDENKKESPILPRFTYKVVEKIIKKKHYETRDYTMYPPTLPYATYATSNWR